jgi:hypothetical protein
VGCPNFANDHLRIQVLNRNLHVRQSHGSFLAAFEAYITGSGKWCLVDRMKAEQANDLKLISLTHSNHHLWSIT